MSNKIELITKYSEDMFDEAYRAESRIGVLDGNTKGMVFVGAKTVKIPKWQGGGLFDYKRANTPADGDFSHGTGTGAGYGYQLNDMGYEWETFTLAVDRAVQYRVDMFDDEETAKTLVARGTNQVNKQVIIPEIDAYAFAKIASAADATLGNLDSTTIIDDSGSVGHASPIEAMNAGLLFLEENEVDSNEEKYMFCSPRFKKALRETSKNGLVKPLLQGEFEKNVKFTIEEYEDTKIISVPPKRFFTNVILGKGFYRRAEAGDAGWAPGSVWDSGTSKWVGGYRDGTHPYIVTGASQDIDFILVAKSAVYHIKKYNKIKVFGPDVVQDYDGYKINAHVYYDLFIPTNKRVAVYVKTNGFTGVGGAYAGDPAGMFASLGVAIDAANKVTAFNVLPGSVLTDGQLYCNSSSIAVGASRNATQLANDKVTLNSTVLGDNTTVYCYVVDTKGTVLAVSPVVCADV